MRKDSSEGTEKYWEYGNSWSPNVTEEFFLDTEEEASSPAVSGLGVHSSITCEEGRG